MLFCFDKAEFVFTVDNLDFTFSVDDDDDDDGGCLLDEVCDTVKSSNGITVVGGNEFDVVGGCEFS
jgi:hypothetical protein